MNESKSGIFIAIITILLILLAISIFMIFKNNNIEQEEVPAGITNQLSINDENNITIENSLEENTKIKNETAASSKVETSNSAELTNAEKKDIEDYINKICNKGFNCKLPVFNDINKADKVWIYSQLYTEDETNFITKQQIVNQLNKLFGSNLKVNVDVDIKENEEFVMPVHSEIYGISGKYALPVLGVDNITYYIIDKISKNNDTFIINVVEFNQWYDLANDPSEKETIISSYNENNSDSWKWKEVFRFDASKITSSNNKQLPNVTLVSEVLKRKNEFCSYNITIEKNTEGLFNVKKVEKVI